MIGIMMDFNVVLWGNRLRAVSARPYKALAKSLFLRRDIRRAETHGEELRQRILPV